MFDTFSQFLISGFPDGLLRENRYIKFGQFFTMVGFNFEDNFVANNFFNKPEPQRGWEEYGNGLYIPAGSVKKSRTLRKDFQAQPLEMHTKTKFKEISKPALAAFQLEVGRLVEKYLSVSTSFHSVLEFERQLEKIGEEYGLTPVVAVDGENIIIDTEEKLSETPGEVAEYQMFADKFHGGAKVVDDIDTFLTKTPDDKEWAIADLG